MTELTEPELRAMDLTVQLVDVFCREVVSGGPPSGADIREFVAHIHCIQHTIMAQAAARAYPDRFRLLGETINEPLALGRPTRYPPDPDRQPRA